MRRTIMTFVLAALVVGLLGGHASAWNRDTYGDQRAAWKYPVAAVCTSNMDLAGNETCDGVAVTTQHVLLTGQSTASQNGIYVAGTAWRRRTDANADGELADGTRVCVSGGTAYADTCWTLTNGPITVGTTSQTWSLTEYTDGEIQVPIAAGHADGGTWTYAVSTGGLETHTRTAADAADSLWAPIPIGNRSGTSRGVKPTGASITYTMGTADCEDFRLEIWKCTQQATGTPISCAVVFGDADADYEDAYDTAAERCDDTAAPGVHTAVLTDAGTPAYLGDGEILLARVYVDGAAASVAKVTSITLLYTGTFADR